MMMNSVEFEECYFAIAKLGATAVPLNWRLVPDELAFILGDAGATTIVFGREFTTVADELRGRAGETALATYVQVGGDVGDWATDYAAAQAGASDEEIDVETDDALRTWLVEKTGQRTVPQIFVGERSLGGFTDLDALDRQGELDPILRG